MRASEVQEHVRKLGGKTQTARVLGVSDVAVHYWVTGARRISADHAERLRAAVADLAIADVSADDVLARVVRIGKVTDVARAIGCSVPLLRRYLLGECPIPMSVVDAIDRFGAADGH